MSIANKIKPKITKVINKFPTNVDIYRDILNEYNEPITNEFICNVTGFYHEGTAKNKADFNTLDKGQILNIGSKKLMVVYNETTMQIKEGDYFYLDNTKYIIRDKGNQNRLNIYFDMLLEVI